MRKFTSVCLFLLVALSAITENSYGQTSFARFMRARAAGENVNSWLRYEAGYSLPIASATYTDVIQTTDYYGNPKEERFSKYIQATSAFGVAAGTYIPISLLSDNSIFALSVTAKGNFYKWSTGDVQLTPNDSYNYDYLTMEIGMPISMDIKWGCDAFMDKSRKTCFALGVGGSPTFIMTGVPTGINPDGSISLAGTNKFIVEPFVKAEAGVMLGICFKVRAMYNFGNISYFKFDGDNESINLQGKSNFLLSLIVMPFSWDWAKDGY